MYVKNMIHRWRSVSPQFLQDKLRKGNEVLRFLPEARHDLHSTLGPLLVIAQSFGLLPVTGVLATSPKGLHFQPAAARTLYAYVLMLSIGVMAILSMVHMAASLRSETFTVLGGLGGATAGAVFYGNAFFATFLFLRLSPHWSSMMRRWSDVEFKLDISRSSRSMTRALPAYALSATIFVLAAVEHGLSVAINIHEAGNSTSWLENYATSSHQFIFSVVPYSKVGGVLIVILSHVATFTWNFVDLFIMLMSQALTQRFQQFNSFLLQNEGRLVSQMWWREAREQYVALASLTRLLDRHMAGITLLSFSNNLYFVCLQLLNGLTPSNSGMLQTIYFWGSFAFLVGRLCFVTLHASNVHHSSRGSLPAIFSCPGPAYCEDVERLQQQICGEPLALTGLGLFHVTRSFLLGVAGAIATYEVVLLQFNVATSSCPVAPRSQPN